MGLLDEFGKPAMHIWKKNNITSVATASPVMVPSAPWTRPPNI